MRSAILTVLTLLASFGGSPTHARADTASSTNWAGYAVHGTSFRQVVGTWRQPGVDCRSGAQGYSAYWVGLGGFSVGSPALEQIGTEADCLSGGAESLTAWYEMVPAPSVTIPMTVDPGDVIEAEVDVRGHTATLVLRDLTRRRSFARSIRAAQTDVSSAEWIVEAPSDCSVSCVTLPLADFGTAVFSAARAQPLDGRAGTITDPRFALTTIDLQPSGGHIASAGAAARSRGAAVVAAPTAAGSSFTVAYAHSPLVRHRSLVTLGPR